MSLTTATRVVRLCIHRTSDGLDAQTHGAQSGDGGTAGTVDGDIGEELSAELNSELEDEDEDGNGNYETEHVSHRMRRLPISGLLR